MKKSTIILFALFISISTFAQQNFKKNELKLNMGTSVFVLYPEISYERILNTDISVGASLGAGTSAEFHQDFNFTPYFRWFFGGNKDTMNKAGAGFFIEANSSVFYRSDEQWSGYYTNDDDWEITYSFERYFAAGIGLGVGWKYVTKNNWVGELMVGAGRGFSNKNDSYPRIGVSIGRRF
jgi:hypothetical protein